MLFRSSVLTVSYSSQPTKRAESGKVVDEVLQDVWSTHRKLSNVLYQPQELRMCRGLMIHVIIVVFESCMRMRVTVVWNCRGDRILSTTLIFSTARLFRISQY